MTRHDASEPTPERLLDLAEIASLAGLSAPHVRRLRSTGQMPAPDVEVGIHRRPAWAPETVAMWLSWYRPGVDPSIGRGGS